MWVAPASSAANAFGDRAARVVVAVKLDVAAGQSAQRAHQPGNLARAGDPHRVGDAQAVDHPQFVHGQVDAQQLGLLAPEGVLGAEAELDVRRLLADPGQHLGRQRDDLVDALAVAELAQPRGGADHHVDAVHARLDGHLRVVPVAADVGQDAGVEIEPGNGAQVVQAAGRRLRRGQFQVFHPELVQPAGDADFLLGGELRIDELLPLAQGGVDNGVVFE